MLLKDSRSAHDTGMLTALLLLIPFAFANPHFDQTQVPKDSDYPPLQRLPAILAPKIILNRIEVGEQVLRVAVQINLAKESFSVARSVREVSGTQSFLRRATKVSKFGSYHAVLRDPVSLQVLASDSIGTGKEYRKLADELTFRFPLPRGRVNFELTAENPLSGKMEVVLNKALDPTSAESVAIPTDGLEIRELKLPSEPGDSIRVNIYAEGYIAKRAGTFWKNAATAIETLVTNDFPGVQHMHFFGVYKPSKQEVGPATDLGPQRKSRDTFLGMYFPYWDKFGRWYDVVYPAREEKFRAGLSVAPYDYSIVLVDDDQYWGMGNFRVTTAVPAQNYAFRYLLLHEAGHFFGLNEEYEGAGQGRTELEFAPGIEEPWSQNITFLPSLDANLLKWSTFLAPQTPIPTPANFWAAQPPKYGAYQGGYAESAPANHSHKPGLDCTMNTGADFCDICKHAIAEVVKFDMGR